MKKGFFIYFILVVMGLAPGILFPGNINIAKVGEWGTGSYRDVFVHGNNAYCLYNGGIDIFDTSDPKNPLKIGSFDTFWRPYSIYVSGNYAYIEESRYTPGGSQSNSTVSGVKGSEETWFRIIDVSVPSAPKKVGTYYSYIGEVTTISTSRNYAYLLYEYSSLEIIDISNPSEPIPVGSCVFTGYNYPEGFFVLGNYAYIVLGDEGLRVVDVSDPSSPVLTGYFEISGKTSYYELYVSGKYAYVTVDMHGNDALMIIDISVPSSPTPVGTWNYSSWSAPDVYVSGNYAYLAINDVGLQIVDVSNPFLPVLVGTWFTDYAHEVYVHGNYAYLGIGTLGLEIVDISDPYSPELLGRCDTPAQARGVYVKGNDAYVADGESGVMMIDVSTPSSPKLAAYYNTTGNSAAVSRLPVGDT